MPGMWRPIDAPLVGALAGATSDMLVINRAMGEQLAMDEPDHKVLKLYTRLADETGDLVLKLSPGLVGNTAGAGRGADAAAEGGPPSVS